MTTPRERELEEILAVVSHDLRNPLGTILMGASTLLHATDASDPKSLRLRGIADRMQRQAERMSRMLGDLGDFAAILGGRFGVEPVPTAASAVLDACTAALVPLAADRDIPVDAGLDGDVPAIQCELERIVQLVVVLGAVGVKVGPRGSRMQLTLAPDPAGVALTLGLPLVALTDEDLPRLFERGWRSAASGYTGAGLAFALAHGIVAAHRGELTATRAADASIAFTATLPAA